MGKTMSKQKRELDLFRRYPWLKIVLFGIGVTAVAVVFAFMGRIANREENVSDKAPGAGGVEMVVEESPDDKVSNDDDEEYEVTREVEQIGAGQIIALTFDDGPSEYTESLLDFLRKKQVPATFFVLGKNANTYPDLVKREALEGHEVESHTMNHQNLAKLSEADVRTEIANAEKTICGILEKANCIKYLRPPYGEISNVVKNVVGKPMIGWSIDTEDWKSKDPQKIQDRTLQLIKGGSIILLHDIYGTSVEGAKRIINELLAAGFTFVTVDEMVQKMGVKLEAGSFYGRFD